MESLVFAVFSQKITYNIVIFVTNINSKDTHFRYFHNSQSQGKPEKQGKNAGSDRKNV